MSFHINTAKTIFFLSKEEYLEYTAAWKARTQGNNLDAKDFFIHTMLMGGDLYRAFSPLKNGVAQGRLPYASLMEVTAWAIHRNAAPDPVSPKNPEIRLFAFLARHREQLQKDLQSIGRGTMTALTAEGF